MHVNADDIVLMGDGETSGFIVERVSPVFLHACNAMADDQITRMRLRVAVDRRIPIFAHQWLAALLAQPLESPLVVSAEIVAA